MTSKFTELAIDCADPSGLARFWCSVLEALRSGRCHQPQSKAYLLATGLR